MTTATVYPQVDRMEIRRRARAQIEAIGEEKFFLRYVETMTVTKALESFGFTESSHHTALYDFLHERHQDTPPTGRWERWQEVRKIVGDKNADQIIELTESLDESNHRSVSAKIRSKQWIAENYNRDNYGKQREQEALIAGSAQDWLQALQTLAKLAPKQIEQPIPEADYTVEAED